MLSHNTRDIQQKFAKYARTGQLELHSEVKKGRMHHYRRLVRNIASGSLSSAYPITKKILSEAEWERLTDDFMKDHNSQEPQVWKYPRELIKYFEQSAYHKNQLDREYLLDLLKFEWMEMEVHGMEDKEVRNLGKGTQNLRGEKFDKAKVVLNPHKKIEHLRYPVHRKNYKEIEKEKGDFFVMCYRKMTNNEVRYLSLNALEIMTIEQMESEKNLKEIKEILKEITKERSEAIEEFLRGMIIKLEAKEVVIGIN